MTDSGQTLLERLETLISANLDNEQFGVEQLAEMMGMSRSHLHRRLQKINGRSISRFIREYRLERAKKMLIEKEMTASEVSHAVGFGSPSYFNKCFTEYFGYSPGKARLKARYVQTRSSTKKSSGKSKLIWLGGLAAIVIGTFLFFSSKTTDTAVAESSPKEKSIIVLPFKNLSSDEENQYLADGMVDAISRHLNTVDELKVLSPLTMIQFGREKPSLEIIGERLNVSNVLTGSIQRNDDIMRLEISLLSAKDGKQLWSQKYDRGFEDILKIQNDIAIKVSAALKANLTSKELSVIDKRTSYDSEAYDNFLKGWNYLNTLTSDNREKSLIYFKKALELDSTLALAQIGMVGYYHFETALYSSKIEPQEALNLAKEYLSKAEALDPDLSHVHASKGYQALVREWSFAETEKAYVKSIESDIPLHYVILRDLYHMENRHEEALELAKIVNEKFYHFPASIMSKPFYYTNNWVEGKQFVEERLKLHPNNFGTLGNSGFFYLNTGEYDSAVALFERILDITQSRNPEVLGYLGAAYANNEEIEKARELLEEIKELKSKSDAGSPAWCIAIIYSALGKKKEALEWLKTAIDDHEIKVTWLVSEPQFYPLHGMPEFDALVKRVGFREHAYPVELPKGPPSVPLKEGS